MSFKQKSIRFKILAGFSSVLLIIVVMGIYIYQSMMDMEGDIKSMKNVIGKQAQVVMEIELLAKEIQEDFTDALVTSETEIADEVREDLKKIHTLIDEFIKVEEAAALKNEFNKMKESADEYFATGERMLRAVSISKKKAMAIMEEFDKDADVVLDFFEKQRVDHIAELNARYEDMYNDVERNVRISAILSLIAVAIGLVIAIAISGSIAKMLLSICSGLKDSSSQIASSSEELSRASQELSANANEQASSIEETSSSLEEINGMVQNNVSNSKQASELSNDVLTKSKNGNQSMEQLQDAMKEILESNDKIEELVKVIGNIGEKTQIMDEIVFQTKLLSFNASVEAERAGEHGRGFAVVAQEVGNLAQMSGKAAQEIAVIVKESIKNADIITAENKKRVEEGNGYVASTAEILTEIMESSSSVAKGSEQVLNASKDQSNGIEQINSAIMQLSKTTQENAATAEETANSSEELNAMVASLDQAVHALTTFVAGQVDDNQKSIYLNQRHSDVPKSKVVVSETKSSVVEEVQEQNSIAGKDWESI